MTEPTKAICMFSGGLDSILALKMIVDQGIHVIALYMHLPILKEDPAQFIQLEELALKLGAKELVIFRPGEEFGDLLANPPHGYGKNANPCLDCRIMVLRAGRRLMEERDAAFVFTGEVVGERPMSQRRFAMNQVERESGLKGRLLRPLSAKILPPTPAEEEGLVDRERLLSIQGRSRKPQMALAKEFGVEDYPTPAGGCLLTELVYGERVHEALAQGERGLDDFRLLRYGRHFRLPDGSRLALGRHADDNRELRELAVAGDYLLEAMTSSPLGLLRHKSGEASEADLRLAASLVAGYTKLYQQASLAVAVERLTTDGVDKQPDLEVAPANRHDPAIRSLMIHSS